MEREADVAHLAAGLRAHHALHGIVAHGLLPTAAVHGMQQVIVYVGGLQALQLLVQEPVEIFRSLVQPCGRFRGDAHLFTQTALERLPQDALRIAADVVVGRVEVVDAAFDGIVDHLDGRFNVHLVDGVAVHRFAAALHGQAHHAKAQGRNLHSGVAKRARFHGTPPCPFGAAALCPLAAYGPESPNLLFRNSVVQRPGAPSRNDRANPPHFHPFSMHTLSLGS